MTEHSFLARPSPAFRDSYLDALREGFFWARHTPFEAEAIAFIAGHFADYLKELDKDGQIPHADHGHRMPSVPSTTFWLVEGGDFIGTVNIRARIDTHVLAHFGGHVGYAIRPARQGQGHGRRILALALEICRGMGIGIVRLSCAEDNAASRRIIEANGGLLLRRSPPAWYADYPHLLYEIPLV